VSPLRKRVDFGVKNQRRQITPDEEIFYIGVDWHLVQECVNGAYFSLSIPEVTI
jgi:hypothetical protein